MLGIPTEKKENMLETIRLNKMIKPDYLFISCFYPLPGSRLYTQCQKPDDRTESHSTISFFVDYSRGGSGKDISEVTYYRNLFQFAVFYPALYPFMKIKPINKFIGRLFYTPVYIKPSLIPIKVVSIIYSYLLGKIKGMRRYAGY